MIQNQSLTTGFNSNYLSTYFVDTNDNVIKILK